MRISKKHIAAISLLVCFLLPARLFAAQTVSEPIPHQVIGYIQEYNTMTIDLDESVFPFNIEAGEVAQNLNPNTITGIRIGSIYMITNDQTFRLTISHDRLKLIDEATGATASILDNTNSVDYRLDVFYDATRYKTIYEGSPATIQVSDLQPGLDSSSYQSPFQIANRNIFVSMAADSSYINGLREGRYISDIVFNLTVEK